jgi:hypothetical protein
MSSREPMRRVDSFFGGLAKLTIGTLMNISEANLM